jgi:hypothetical protein
MIGSRSHTSVVRRVGQVPGDDVLAVGRDLDREDRLEFVGRIAAEHVHRLAVGVAFDERDSDVASAVVETTHAHETIGAAQRHQTDLHVLVLVRRARYRSCDRHDRQGCRAGEDVLDSSARHVSPSAPGPRIVSRLQAVLRIRAKRAMTTQLCRVNGECFAIGIVAHSKLGWPSRTSSPRSARLNRRGRIRLDW